MEREMTYRSFNKELRPLVKVRERYRRARKCVGSKAAMVILFWYFAISFAYALLFHKNTVVSNYLSHYSMTYIVILTSVYVAALQLLFPAAGYLSDTKLGRFKTIQISLGILLLALFCLIVTGALTFFLQSQKIISTAIFYTVWLFFLFGLPGFNVNVIQFGLDQLFQSPADDQNLFIQWYYWINSFSNVLVKVFININHKIGTGQYIFPILTIPFILTTVIILATFYLFVKKRNWFLIITRYKNPYLLVYKVTKFSFQNRASLPISSLNCGSENMTSRLDVANEKYSGPFTTEQVEDVKSFYGVLKILFSLIPAMLTHTAATEISLLFASHLQSSILDSNDLNVIANNNFDSHFLNFVLANGTIFYGTLFVIIPVFILIIRPIVRDYIPGMLEKIGIGAGISLLSVMILFVVDILIHTENENAGCIFSMYLADNQTLESNLIIYNQYPATILLIVQQILAALADIIFYIALYQFICSQSPHSMKGFLLGIFFAARGISHMMSALMLLPFAMKKYTAHAPSCGIVYYIVVTVIGVGGLVVYSCIAKRYKLRVREDAHAAGHSNPSNYLTI